MRDAQDEGPCASPTVLMASSSSSSPSSSWIQPWVLQHTDDVEMSPPGGHVDKSSSSAEGAFPNADGGAQVECDEFAGTGLFIEYFAGEGVLSKAVASLASRLPRMKWPWGEPTSVTLKRFEQRRRA